jgi:MbtH protein
LFDDETIDYFVVINGEEQYSIWPAQRDVPDGWEAVGSARSREECLTYIEQVWTDMRPKSVREAMAGQSGSCPDRPRGGHARGGATVDRA